MRKVLLLSFFFWHAVIANCQQNKTNKFHHAIYVEAAGPAIYGALNYDISYSPVKNVCITSGIGFSKYSIGSWRYTYILPKGNLLYSNKGFHGGVGVAWAASIYSFPGFLHSEYRYTLTRGFLFPYAHVRYQPLKRGIYVGLSTYAVTRTDNVAYFIRLDKATSHKYDFFARDFVLWPGLSLGYTFPHKKQE